MFNPKIFNPIWETIDFCVVDFENYISLGRVHWGEEKFFMKWIQSGILGVICQLEKFLKTNLQKNPKIQEVISKKNTTKQQVFYDAINKTLFINGKKNNIGRSTVITQILDNYTGYSNINASGAKKNSKIPTNPTGNQTTAISKFNKKYFTSNNFLIVRNNEVTYNDEIYIFNYKIK